MSYRKGTKRLVNLHLQDTIGTSVCIYGFLENTLHYSKYRENHCRASDKLNGQAILQCQRQMNLLKSGGQLKPLGDPGQL